MQSLRKKIPGWQKVYNFLYLPASAAPLGALRIGVGLVLLVQAAWMSADIFPLFARDGVLQGELSDWMATLALPNINWLQKQMQAVGLAPRSTVSLVYGLYLVSLVGLILGWKSRFMAFMSWMLHFLLYVSGFTLAYGVDHFANIFLFLMIWMPIGDAWAVDGKGKVLSSAGARLAIRVCQFQLCVVYFTSGIYKAKGIQWWNGEAIWRAVMMPLESHVDSSWLASLPWLAMLLCWATLFIEIGYPFLMSYRRTRLPAVFAVASLHIGIAVFLGLVSFGMIMLVLTVAMFGFSADRQCHSLPAA